MELRPSPECWRVALVTAIGANAVIAVGGAGALGGWRAVWFWWAVVAAGIATFLPALGTMTARIDADGRGVSVTRLGRTRRFAWTDIEAVHVIQRRASVPDGTEYHWWFPSRRAHHVAVPTLELAGGQARELPALALPVDAEGAGAKRAAEVATALEGLRISYATVV